LRKEPTANEGTYNSPMRRSPTSPNPVPCTIWPASHPAMRPTTKMIRRLSLEMCISYPLGQRTSGKTILGPGNASPINKTAWPKVNPRLSGGIKGSPHIRQSGYDHSEEKTVQNCSTQELCGFVAAKPEHLNLVCRQSLQRILPGLTRLFPRAEPVDGFFYRKRLTFAKNFPGIWVRRRASVFYFHSKMACDR
jgi:hypothetical protein